MNEFRELRANEIDVRIQSISKGKNGIGAILLLYKDARCDMNILDETVGILGWKREHKMIGDRLYCVVSLYDDEKKEWISKEDVGTESNTEAEKGHASDSFKRACFNWGIGRELYTAPFTYIQLNEGEYYDDKGRTKSNAKFYVDEIEYESRRISRLVLMDSKNNIRFSYSIEPKATREQLMQLVPNYTGDSLKKLLYYNKIMRIEDLPRAKAEELIIKLKEKKNA